MGMQEGDQIPPTLCFFVPCVLNVPCLTHVHTHVMQVMLLIINITALLLWLAM